MDRLWTQGRRVRRQRRILDMTQGELARRVSELIGEVISHNIISQIEKGNRDIWNNEMNALEVILGVPRSWLEGVDPDPYDRNRDNPRYRDSVVDNHSLWQRMGLTTHFPLPSFA